MSHSRYRDYGSKLEVCSVSRMLSIPSFKSDVSGVSLIVKRPL